MTAEVPSSCRSVPNSAAPLLTPPANWTIVEISHVSKHHINHADYHFIDTFSSSSSCASHHSLTHKYPTLTMCTRHHKGCNNAFCISIQYLQNELLPLLENTATVQQHHHLSTLGHFPPPILRYLSEQCVVNVVIVVTSVKYRRLVLSKSHAFLVSFSWHPSPFMSLSRQPFQSLSSLFFYVVIVFFFLVCFLSYSWVKIICFFDHHRARQPSRSPRNAKTKTSLA